MKTTNRKKTTPPLTLALELPQELVHRIQAVKPPWLAGLTDEQFLSQVIAHGNFDEYLGQIQKANQQVQDLTAGLDLRRTAIPSAGKGGAAMAKATQTTPTPIAT